MRFPAKKNAGCPKAPRDFPPRKDDILYPPLGCLGTPLPLPQSLCGRTDGRSYVRTSRDNYVTAKISRIDRLPNLLSNGAPLAGFARRLRYETLHTFEWVTLSLKFFSCLVFTSRFCGLSDFPTSATDRIRRARSSLKRWSWKSFNWCLRGKMLYQRSLF